MEFGVGLLLNYSELARAHAPRETEAHFQRA